MGLLIIFTIIFALLKTIQFSALFSADTLVAFRMLWSEIQDHLEALQLYEPTLTTATLFAKDGLY